MQIIKRALTIIFFVLFIIVVIYLQIQLYTKGIDMTPQRFVIEYKEYYIKAFVSLFLTVIFGGTTEWH